MAKLGIVTGSGGQVGVGTGRAPHLVNLNEDPLMSELLLYYLSAEHPTKLGFDTEESQADIKLSGGTIKARHCEFVIGEDGEKSLVASLDVVV
jgi:kinesin family protein 1